MKNTPKLLVIAALLGATSMAQAATETAVFAGGCFWGVDAVFKHVKGVEAVVSGYAGGEMTNPNYMAVSSGTTGHAESVMVKFNPEQVSYSTLLEVFFKVAHNPTELNRQGPDTGTQYRSAVFYRDAAQKKVIEDEIQVLTKAHTFAKPIVTEVAPLSKFYKAEDYHQNYLAGHLSQPYIVYNDLPKIEALKQQFPALYVK
jgi:peptide-methionine (S)-S-oxide reductase